MKTLNNLKTLLFVIALFCFVQLQAQTKRQTVTVLNVDTKGIALDPAQMGNLVRIELEKLDTFDVTDRYDVGYLIDKNQLNVANCYGKKCLIETGNAIKSDYMFTGSVELYGQTIITTFRLINVHNESIERTIVMEYLNLPLEVQSMCGLSIKHMFGRKIDEELEMRLTKKFDYENAINNPDKNKLSLNGPRFGYTFIFGTDADRLQANSKDGGFETYPAMFQFGYQFEKQYLNEGNFQALFEFIPMITGMDQKRLIPNVIFLNGFRDVKHGWEIAIGPAIGIAKYSDLYKYNGKYYTSTELYQLTGKNASQISSPEKVLDSRGEDELTTSLVLAFGKTYKSGKMNIPVNLYITIPNRDGFRLGISVGYNSKK